jgi:hypothetical protein
MVQATKTLPQQQTEALDRAATGASSLEQAISLLKAAGYRVTKSKPKAKDRVGPTFVACFADGQVTRMSTYTSLTSLDRARGERLSLAAYESRMKQAPPTIMEAHFEQDGVVLERYQQ